VPTTLCYPRSTDRDLGVILGLLGLKGEQERG
jgi:hypothetical protein